jgi:hypothetical protein
MPGKRPSVKNEKQGARPQHGRAEPRPAGAWTLRAARRNPHDRRPRRARWARR